MGPYSTLYITRSFKLFLSDITVLLDNGPYWAIAENTVPSALRLLRTHYMKTSNTDIFKCLCLDLDMPLRESSKVPSSAVLGELRKRLLECVKCEDNDGSMAYADFDVDFHRWFKPTRGLIFGDVATFRDVYQLLSFPLKIRKQHTHEQEQIYVSNFLKNEATTRNWRVDRSNPVTRIARQLIRRLMVNRSLDHAKLHGLGRHGPGAVYGHEVGTDKNFFSDPPHDLALSYPDEFFYCNSNFVYDHAIMSTTDRSCRHVQSRLVLVPKDYRGPRGVFTSPKEVMFCQLAQDRFFKELAKTSWLGLCYNPDDQSPSQETAFVGSWNRSWDTLDLSDASDRVPLSLVAYLFNRKDYLAIARTRPSFVELPDGSLHRMSMFSPMGDGKTFSILSTLVAVLTVSAMLARDGFNADELIPMDEVRLRAKFVRVFGDDIAIHEDYFYAVCESLEIHNLKVNVPKSFHEGFFREACGMDAFRGHDVTPMRQKPDFDRTFDYHMAVEFHNRMVRFYPRFERTIALARLYIEDAYPYTGYTSNCVRHPNCLLVSKDMLNRIVFGPRYGQHGCRCPLRYNPDTQVPELLTYAPKVEQNSIMSLNPWWDLNYWLLTRHSSGLDTGDCVRTEWISDDHIDCRGSRIATKQYEAMLRQATGKRIGVRSVGYPRTWVSIE